MFHFLVTNYFKCYITRVIKQRCREPYRFIRLGIKFPFCGMSISTTIKNITPNFLLDNLTDNLNTVITMNKVYIRVRIMNNLATFNV